MSNKTQFQKIKEQSTNNKQSSTQKQKHINNSKIQKNKKTQNINNFKKHTLDQQAGSTRRINNPQMFGLPFGYSTAPLI